MATRAWRFVLVGGLTSFACFTDPPGAGEDASSTGTGGGTTLDASTSSEGTGTEGTGTSSNATTSADASTTAATSEPTMGSTDESSSSTGSSGPDCECPDNAWECAPFEEGLPDGWDGSVSTGNDPELEAVPDAPCGTYVVTASVPAGGNFSQVGVQRQGIVTSPSFTADMYLEIDGSCVDFAGPSRAVQLQLLGGQLSVGYNVELWMGAGGGELRGSVPGGGIVVEPFGLGAPEDRWLHVTLEVDLNDGAQTRLVIDGETLASLDSPLDPGDGLDAYELNVQLGMYRAGEPFPEACAMSYDQFVLAPAD